MAVGCESDNVISIHCLICPLCPLCHKSHLDPILETLIGYFALEQPHLVVFFCFRWRGYVGYG